jgi:hypothetical protein
VRGAGAYRHQRRLLFPGQVHQFIYIGGGSWFYHVIRLDVMDEAHVPGVLRQRFLIVTYVAGAHNSHQFFFCYHLALPHGGVA